jgi:competence protein ComEA
VLEFNRVELRALLVSTGLLALGAVARLGLGPGPETFQWEPASPGTSSETAVSLGGVREAVREGILREERAAMPLGVGERLDPNTAPPEELRRLPGIGPARARAIADERLRSGPFRTLTDLTRVPGVGPATVQRLAPHISLPGRERYAAPGTRAMPVDVNRAQPKELEQITGIGPALARRIVETRRRLGGFRSAEDLLQVPGIGPQTLQKIRAQVLVR